MDRTKDECCLLYLSYNYAVLQELYFYLTLAYSTDDFWLYNKLQIRQCTHFKTLEK